jgi:glucose-fructose oxidoreductase
VHDLCTSLPAEEADHGEVRQEGVEDGRVGHETPQARHPAERFGPQGHEPEAGDRDRAERGPEEGRQGPQAAVDAEAQPPEPSLMATRRTRRPAVKRRVRYAVVGIGHIAQAAVLPAFANARRNSALAAIVSDDPKKQRAIARRYGLDRVFSYDEFEECLQTVDAVYIAVPNSAHAEFTIRAANAGVHVLCEKPMAVTEDDCLRMIQACRVAQVRLMIAYRLHFEEINLRAIELVRRGRLGDPKYFNSSFSLSVRDGDIRTRRALGGGTLYDIGVYCINAARYLFRAEPVEVVACSVNSGVPRLSEIDETTAAILRFDGGRVASFVTSFNAADVSMYRVVGTRGELVVDPAYEYADGLAYRLTVGGRTHRKTIGRRDQFAPELLYFSDCILQNRKPEPSGEEGLQDVRIVQALYESAETGKPVAIPPFDEDRAPSLAQMIVRPAVDRPRLVHARGARR